MTDLENPLQKALIGGRRSSPGRTVSATTTARSHKRRAAARATCSTATAGATTRWCARRTASTAPARARGRSTSRTASSRGRRSRPTTPRAGPDKPEYEPRGCPRGAAFSWYTYCPTRVRYPYVRGVLLEMFRAAKQQQRRPRASPGGDIVQRPGAGPALQGGARQGRPRARVAGTRWPRSSPQRTSTPIKRWGPDRIAGFSPIPAMSPVSYAFGARFLELIGAPMLSFYDWYADLPNASPQMFGDQTDVPESGDWWDAGYLIMWGSNVPIDPHPGRALDDRGALPRPEGRGRRARLRREREVRRRVGDSRARHRRGLAMAMGHVVLKEFFVDQEHRRSSRLQQAVHRPAAPQSASSPPATAPTAPASTSSPATSATRRADRERRCGSRPIIDAAQRRGPHPARRDRPPLRRRGCWAGGTSSSATSTPRSRCTTTRADPRGRRGRAAALRRRRRQGPPPAPRRAGARGWGTAIVTTVLRPAARPVRRRARPACRASGRPATTTRDAGTPAWQEQITGVPAAQVVRRSRGSGRRTRSTPRAAA